MGVVHSMDDGQVQRVSNALKESAQAIQGINSKFDVIDEHWKSLQDFNTKINSKVKDSLSSFQRLDATFSSKAEVVMANVENATQDLTLALEFVLAALDRFDVRREMNQLPKAFIPLSIPLIILLIELAVANAYLGILLSSIPEIGDKYSTYLLANASSVLLGLMLSLVWLGVYRAWLSHKTRRGKDQNEPREPRNVEGDNLKEFLDRRLSQRDQDPSHCTSSSTMNPEDRALSQVPVRMPSNEDIGVQPIFSDQSSESYQHHASANASRAHPRPPPIETDGYLSQPFGHWDSTSPEPHRARPPYPFQQRIRRGNSPNNAERQKPRQQLREHKEGVGDADNPESCAQVNTAAEPHDEVVEAPKGGFGPRKNWRWRKPFEVQVTWANSKTQVGGSSSSNSGPSDINRENENASMQAKNVEEMSTAERVPQREDASVISSATRGPQHDASMDSSVARVSQHEGARGSSSSLAAREPQHEDANGSSRAARMPQHDATESNLVAQMPQPERARGSSAPPVREPPTTDAAPQSGRQGTRSDTGGNFQGI